ncbi:MAG: hypothetical protein AAFU67_17150 [Bacteroidota bacterium]
MIHTLNLAVTCALFGLIWTIQLVHYPSFRYVTDFSTFHPHHTASITLVVGPLMLAEIALAAIAVVQSSFNWQWLVLLGIVLVIWGLTFFWAVPLHEKLAVERTEKDIEALIMANWPRTILWTIKTIWLLLICVSPLGSEV